MVNAEVRTVAKRAPQAAALSVAGRVVSYGALVRLIDEVAREIEREVPVDRWLGLSMPPDEFAVAALLAAEHTDRRALLFPTTLPAVELLALLDEARVHYMLASGPILQGTAGWLRKAPSSALQGWQWCTRRVTEQIAHGLKATADIPMLAQLTSGSLGPSRFAVRGRRGVQTELEAVTARLSLDAGDVVWCTSSIAHSYGLMGGLLAPLQVGAQVVLGTEPPRDLRPTVTFGLSSVYRALLTRPGAADMLGQGRYALSAGAPLPVGLYDAALRTLGVSIRQDYGTTECGTICLDLPGQSAPGTVGLPLAHTEIRVVQPVDRMIAADEQGELLVRSVSVAADYLARGGDISVCDEEGWFHTGDAGTVDDQGRVKVGRRLRPPLLLGGERVDPDQLERELAGVEGVQQAAVLPSVMGAKAARVVVVAPGLEADEIVAAFRRRAPALSVAVDIEIRAELPRSPAGKILRKYLGSESRDESP